MPAALFPLSNFLFSAKNSYMKVAIDVVVSLIIDLLVVYFHCGERQTAHLGSVTVVYLRSLQ